MRVRTFRPVVARVIAWAVLVFVAANLVDVGLHGSGGSGVAAAVVLVAMALLAYVLGLRPAVSADDEAVVLHNLLRDVRLPWPAVTAIGLGDVLRVEAGGRVHRSWAITGGGRSRRPSLREQRQATHLRDRGLTPFGPTRAAAAEAAAGSRRYGDFVVDELTSLWQQGRSGARSTDGGPAARVQPRWSWPAVAAVVLAVAGIAGTIVVGALS